jgi:hypothetical protein
LSQRKWIGKRFPLLPFIEDAPGQSQPGERPLRERLAEGDWIVVLYHHDCPKCQEKMPRYGELANRAAFDSTAPQVALIEIPPYGETNALPILADSGYALGRLRDSNKWLVETPLDLFLRSPLVIPMVDTEYGTFLEDRVVH